VGQAGHSVIVIDTAVSQWRRHLSAGVRAVSGAFISDIVFLRSLCPLKSLLTSQIELLIFSSDFLAVVSYHIAHFNT